MIGLGAADMWGLPDKDICGLPALWYSDLIEGSRIGGRDAGFIEPRYDEGLDVGVGLLRLGIIFCAMVGVVLGVARGVKGCISPPVISDKG